MKIRPIYTISIIIFILALCVIGWFTFKPKNMELVKVYKTTLPEPRTDKTSQVPFTLQTPQQRQEDLQEQAKKRKEGVLQNMRIIRGIDSDPHLDKLQKAMESQAYLEYLQKQEAVEGYDAVLYLDFLKSQGASKLGGEKFMEDIFRIYFPEGEPIDYEPMMRKQLAELALEYPTENSVAILSRLREEPANNLWAIAHFNGWVGVYDWAESIHQNAASIVAEFTPIDIESGSFLTSSGSIPESSTTQVAEENGDFQQGPSEDVGSLADHPHILQVHEEPEIELTKDIPTEIINRFAPNTDLRKTLGDRFSPQRFETAIQTLTRYGPEEGLRKIKESDPEMGRHFEQFIHSHKETD